MHSSHCLNCHQPASWIFVHGHYQCARCGMNMMPCCDGDNCNTNWLLKPDLRSAVHPVPSEYEDKTGLSSK